MSIQTPFRNQKIPCRAKRYAKSEKGNEQPMRLIASFVFFPYEFYKSAALVDKLSEFASPIDKNTFLFILNSNTVEFFRRNCAK